jgi:hypothetical protein
MKKKIHVIGITLIFIVLGFSGCVEEEQKTPNISFSVDGLTLIVTDADSGLYYASSATEPNIKFVDMDSYNKNYEDNYVSSSLSLTRAKSSTNKAILIDDVITHFLPGHTYNIIWIPTDSIIDEVTMPELSLSIEYHAGTGVNITDVTKGLYYLSENYKPGSLPVTPCLYFGYIRFDMDWQTYFVNEDLDLIEYDTNYATKQIEVGDFIGPNSNDNGHLTAFTYPYNYSLNILIDNDKYSLKFGPESGNYTL